MIQVISVAGSLLILAAYTANQAGRMSTERLAYSALNVIGSAILAVVAVHESQWGFVLLESVWTVVSVIALVRLTRARAT
jgi:hypothetical protein